MAESEWESRTAGGPELQPRLVRSCPHRLTGRGLTRIVCPRPSLPALRSLTRRRTPSVLARVSALAAKSRNQEGAASQIHIQHRCITEHPAGGGGRVSALEGREVVPKGGSTPDQPQAPEMLLLIFSHHTPR